MSASIKKNVKLGSFPVDGAEARVLWKRLRALLVAPDLAESDGSRPVAARLLHASGRRHTLPGGLRLRRELLSWGLA